jgi:hypothetical protein
MGKVSRTRTKFQANLLKMLIDWYKGHDVDINDPSMPFIRVIPGIRQERPWIAKSLNHIGRFVLLEWKWVIGFILAVLALYASFFLKR